MTDDDSGETSLSDLKESVDRLADEQQEVIQDLRERVTYLEKALANLADDEDTTDEDGGEWDYPEPDDRYLQ